MLRDINRYKTNGYSLPSKLYSRHNFSCEHDCVKWLSIVTGYLYIDLRLLVIYLCDWKPSWFCHLEPNIFLQGNDILKLKVYNTTNVKLLNHSAKYLRIIPTKNIYYNASFTISENNIIVKWRWYKNHRLINYYFYYYDIIHNERHSYISLALSNGF